MSLNQIGANLCFGGKQLRFEHDSSALQCKMNFSIFLPPQAEHYKVPVLYYLSGLTCTDENFVQKAGAQQYAAEHGIAIVAPDTSPRGEGVPDDVDGSWDFGLGAGFYCDATEAPWNKHYKMYSYISKELPELINSSFPVDATRQSITGHSMGGHGALTIALKNPSKFKSASAFAPITSPLNCPWGEKALGNYIGSDREQWKAYDSCELIKVTQEKLPILIDQGGADNFLITQLKPELLQAASIKADYPITLRLQAGYDHSYFFIASFIGEHIAFHARHLNA